MLKDNTGLNGQHFVLSSLPPGPAQKRLALGIVLSLLFALYLVTGPFGGMQLGAIHSFVAIFTTAMFVTDALTAILLYAQFSVTNSRAILVIASGYLFSALLIVPYALAFPGVLAPQGLVGGLQTTAHLYLLWHCGFPLFAIGYAVLKDREPDTRYAPGKVAPAIVRSVVCTAVGALAVAIYCIRGGPGLPDVMADEARFVPNWLYVVGAPISVLSVLAIFMIWMRRRSILDLFLMVVLSAYVIEILPHWYPTPARFSIGWYAVRVTSLVSSSIVLVVLLYEITSLYGALLHALLRQRGERNARLMTGDAVAASIAHEVRQPLTAMITTADAGFRFLDRPTPNVVRAKEAFRRIAEDGHRAGALVGSIRDNFKGDARDMTSLDVNDLIREVLAFGGSDLQKYRVSVQTESSTALPMVRGNRVQLQQVLFNLITNAIDAMATRDDPRILSIRSAACEDHRVIVAVADTGGGVAVSDAHRVFNPLFTTKADGMGMGLSICRAIIEAHNGRLWFVPNTPRGSVFQFTLEAAK
jgi:signal transduction histidine kinase